MLRLREVNDDDSQSDGSSSSEETSTSEASDEEGEKKVRNHRYRWMVREGRNAKVDMLIPKHFTARLEKRYSKAPFESFLWIGTRQRQLNARFVLPLDSPILLEHD
eukprot:2747382-Amphidinium_carterae.1